MQPRLKQLLIPAWLRTWWPALLWAAVIFTMSTDAFSAQHTASFFEPILRWFIPGLTREQFHVIHHYMSWGLTALFIAASYSALDEIHQAFVASREASPYDSLIDSTGALFAFAILWLWLHFRNRQSTVSGS